MRFIVAALLTVTVGFFTAPAFAAEEYYVEIGNESSEQDAISQWKNLTEKYKDTLGDTKFLPKTVFRSERKTVVRIQAGPIVGKDKAKKLCADLFKKDIPCFIIEGLQYTPPPPTPEPVAEAATAPIAAEAAPLPWANKTAEPAPRPVEIIAEPAEKERKGFMPWLFGSDEDEEEEAPLTPSAEGNVKVSEAIRVPLTRDTVKEEPLLKPAPAPQVLPAPLIAQPKEEAETPKPLLSLKGAAGWLNVASFESEEDASGLWQKVREASPTQAAGLRVRFIKPMVSHNQPAVRLNVGPFPSQSDAIAFCNNSIKPQDKGLACEFELAEPRTTTARLITPRYEHTNAYAARRQSIASRRVPRGNSLSASGTQQAYWIQVATASSQMEALGSWDNLRSNHSDLLQNMRSSVSAMATGRAGYVVRVGPINSHDRALGLYKALKDRGIDCRIYSNM